MQGGLDEHPLATCRNGTRETQKSEGRVVSLRWRGALLGDRVALA